MSLVRIIVAAVGLGSMALVACGDAVDEVKNRITCHDVCKRYADCFDDDYDVDECTSRCENKATPDEDKEKQLERCDACIDGESCGEAVFECTTECVEFVP